MFDAKVDALPSSTQSARPGADTMDTTQWKTFMGIQCAAVVLAAILAIGSVQAQTSKAATAFARKDYVTALVEFEKLAEQGDRKAQYNTGWLYEKGLGGAPSPDKAAAWYLKAAGAGLAAAQIALGLLYYHGAGVLQDYEAAVSWYEKAANQGETKAQLLLGMAHYEGLAGKPDDSQALYWLGEAAKRGSKLASTLR